MSAIAIITARGGSKRIPGKNIKEFCGKPIIAYSIEAAIKSGCFDEIMVSTDSEDIKKVAISYGATVPFMRSTDTANDYATTADVLKEVIGKYKDEGREFEYFACIYPTAPFITAEKLKRGLKLLEDKKALSVVPVVKFSFPPQRAFVIDNERLQYQYPQYENSRSQDLEPIFHDAGQFYVCQTEGFLKYNSLITPYTSPLIVPEEEVQDIDTLSDWNIAEIKYNRLLEREM